MSNTELITALESRFIVTYQDTETHLQSSIDNATNAIMSGIELGELVIQLKRHKGDSFWQWINGLDTQVRRKVLDFAHRAHVRHHRGLPISGNQIALALDTGGAVDDDSTPLRRTRRPVESRYIRWAGQIRKQFNDRWKERPVEQWDPQEAREALAALQPVIEVAEKLREAAQSR